MQQLFHVMNNGLGADYALFATIVDLGSLSAAGRELRISPAVVSKRLAQLEGRLGVRLISRTTRRLALTPAGESFLVDIRGILASIKNAEDRITGLRDEPSGRLRVSAPTSFARLHVAPRMGAFLASYPRVEFGLDLSDHYVDLVSERVDLAIRIMSNAPSPFRAHRLANNRRVLTASPAYIAAHGAPDAIGDLAHHRLLAADGQLPWHLVTEGRSRTVAGKSYVQTNSSEIVRELALAGVGIALRSLWDVATSLATGELVRVLPGWEGQRDLGIYAVHANDPGISAATRAFVDFLRLQFDPAPWEAAEQALGTSEDTSRAIDPGR